MAARRGLRPPPRLNLVEWAERYRRLTSETSSVTGPWRTETVEVARGPMLAVTDPEVHTITAMTCTQLLKTELLNNTAGYFVHQDAAPILVIQPTTQLGESWSKDRFDKMRQASPPLRALIRDPRSRDSGNTIRHKEFPGGHLTVVGANSPVDLASRPIRVVLADEVDKYPPSAGKEGDPLTLAEERAANFWNRKSIRACSPTVKGFSRIESEYLAGDQRKPFLACPHCGHEQVLQWSGVRWDKDEAGNHDARTAAYHCEECGVAWDETERQRLLRTKGAVLWRQTKPFHCCGEEHKPSQWDHAGRSLCPECGKRSDFDGHASFWASKLYSPWERLPRIVRKWLGAQGRHERLKTFVNTQLAETWEEDAERVDEATLRGRAEDWGENAPSDILVITAGVDVQDDRLEVETVGWGLGEESWSLAHTVLYGDPSGPDLWQQLDDLLLTGWETEDGRRLAISAAAVDTGGHFTAAAYSFCRPRFTRRVYAIKGVGGSGRPVWPKRASKNNKGRVNLFLVGVDAAKDMVLSRLKTKEPGPGYCHFPAGRDDEYFRQLTAERVVTKYVKGFPARVYEKDPSIRNEALDLRVYAYAALVALNVRWGKLQSGRSAPAPSAPREAQAPEVPPSPPPAPVPAQPVRRPRVIRSSVTMR